MKRYAATIITAMLYLNLGLLAVFTAVPLVAGQFGLGIILLIFHVIMALYVWWVRDRIPFAAVMLEISTGIVKAYPATIWVSLGFLALDVIWIIWWCAIAAAYSSKEGYSAVVIFLLLISFYWTLEVLKNIVRCTVAGTTAAWFFSAQPTVTTSFGSICLGSLIVAFISALRAMVRSARNADDGVLRCLCDFFLSCLERLVQYSNVYAFAQVAIYGSAKGPEEETDQGKPVGLVVGRLRVRVARGGTGRKGSAPS